MLIDERFIAEAMSTAADQFRIDESVIEEILNNSISLQAPAKNDERFTDKDLQADVSEIEEPIWDELNETESITLRFRKRAKKISASRKTLPVAIAASIVLTIFLTLSIAGINHTTGANVASSTAKETLPGTKAPSTSHIPNSSSTSRLGLNEFGKFPSQPQINSQGETFSGSASGSSSSAAVQGAAQAAAQAAQAPPPGQNSTQSISPVVPGAIQPPPSQNAIEKTGSVVLSVKYGTFNETINRLSGLATGSGGFVGNSQSQSENGLMTGSITLEVPVNSFESVVGQVESLGKVVSVSTKATNVTGQVVDLASRIQALQDSLAQYEKILSQAYSIGDVLSVQSQIDSIQSQIEHLQGEQNLMNSVTIYSSLNISVNELGRTGHPVQIHTPESGIALAWHKAINGFARGFDDVIAIAGPLLFGLIALIIALFIFKFSWKSIRRWIL